MSSVRCTTGCPCSTSGCRRTPGRHQGPAGLAGARCRARSTALPPAARRRLRCVASDGPAEAGEDRPEAVQVPFPGTSSQLPRHTGPRFLHAGHRSPGHRPCLPSRDGPLVTSLRQARSYQARSRSGQACSHQARASTVATHAPAAQGGAGKKPPAPNGAARRVPPRFRLPVSLPVPRPASRHRRRVELSVQRERRPREASAARYRSGQPPGELEAVACRG